MCARYEVLNSFLIAQRFHVRHSEIVLTDNLDVRPTDWVPTITADRTLSPMRWGLVPAWPPDTTRASTLINARSETVADKPAFRRPLRTQRCLLPASAFFEWQGEPGAKVTWRIARQDGVWFSFAGLSETWVDPDGVPLPTCSLLTTTPIAEVSLLHHRMPVILLPDDEDRWLNAALTTPTDLLPLLRPLSRWPVGSAHRLMRQRVTVLS